MKESARKFLTFSLMRFLLLLLTHVEDSQGTSLLDPPCICHPPGCNKNCKCARDDVNGVGYWNRTDVGVRTEIYQQCNCYLHKQLTVYFRKYGDCFNPVNLVESFIACPTGVCSNFHIYGKGENLHARYCGPAGASGCETRYEDGFTWHVCHCDCETCNGHQDHCNTCQDPSKHKCALYNDYGTTIIQSPRITNWGWWGAMSRCDLNYFVTGFKLQVEPKGSGKFDDAALMAIEFVCSRYNAPQTQMLIHSLGEGRYGKWGTKKFCPGPGERAVGFQLRSEKDQGANDNTAGNNLRVFCEGGSVLDGDGHDWGDWSEPQYCPFGTFICGLQTQVDLYEVNEVTGLNNVDVRCCHGPPLLPPTTPTTSQPTTSSTPQILTTSRGTTVDPDPVTMASDGPCDCHCPPAWTTTSTTTTTTTTALDQGLNGPRNGAAKWTINPVILRPVIGVTCFLMPILLGYAVNAVKPFVVPKNVKKNNFI